MLFTIRTTLPSGSPQYISNHRPRHSAAGVPSAPLPVYPALRARAPKWAPSEEVGVCVLEGGGGAEGPGVGGCEQRHRSAERASAGVNLGNRKPDPMCCSMLRASSYGVSPCHVGLNITRKNARNVGRKLLQAVLSFPDRILPTNERTTLCDNDNIHVRYGSDAYKLENFNGIMFRLNGVNTHGGNKRIVQGDIANGVLEGSFNELIFCFRIMQYQSGKGGFAMRRSRSD